LQVLQLYGSIMSTKSKVLFDSRGNRYVLDKTTTNVTSETFNQTLDDLPKPLCEEYKSIRPNHYGGAGAIYEVFNVLEAWSLDTDFYLGNVIKYVARAGKKDPAKTKEDLQKALVYLQRRIDSLE
jgi:hypothetical protein